MVDVKEAKKSVEVIYTEKCFVRATGEEWSGPTVFSRKFPDIFELDHEDVADFIKSLEEDTIDPDWGDALIVKREYRNTQFDRWSGMDD